MAPKNRLTHADFQMLRKSAGKRYHGTYFSLLVASLPASAKGESPPGRPASPRLPRGEQAGASGGKFACVVSKKVSARAVDRNRVKRRCRAAARGYLAAMKNHALVFSAKREAARASFQDIEHDVTALFARLNKAG